MAREIKFRVRGHRTKRLVGYEWLEGECWYYMGHPGRVTRYGVFDGGFLRERYTGLTDKNGVEIYEGDIVMRVNQDPSPTMKVAFRRACWVLETTHWTKNTDLYPEAHILEVIGNIYQDKHLLDGK